MEEIEIIKNFIANLKIVDLDDEIESIEKKLELLEILKRNIFKSDSSISIIIDDLRNFDDFKKVKEWLEK